MLHGISYHVVHLLGMDGCQTFPEIVPHALGSIMSQGQAEPRVLALVIILVAADTPRLKTP